MRFKNTGLILCKAQASTYLIHPLALFKILSRKVLIISHTKNFLSSLKSWLRRFVPVLETPGKLQFTIKGKLFTILTKTEFGTQESYLYNLLGLRIRWQGELAYLRGLIQKGSYTETRRLGGLIRRPGFEFYVTPSYDVARFYVSIGLSLTHRPLTLSPANWRKSWDTEERWVYYSRWKLTYRARAFKPTLASDVFPALVPLLWLNLIQKDRSLGKGLPNYFIGLLSLENSTFNYIDSV
jgi:hypothetical protein